MINKVIDCSHHNIISDFDDIISDGIIGMFHKATEGTKYTDTKYRNRKVMWKDLKSKLWGAYHFASRGSGTDQARHFLDCVQPDEQTLLVLDYERSLSGGLMPIVEAEAFVQHIFETTGRYPGIYSCNDLREVIISEGSIIENCWLWVARYGHAQPFVPLLWGFWTMWQYTDGHNGNQPHSVKGIGNCDRNYFNGDLAGLYRLWNVPMPVIA